MTTSFHLFKELSSSFTNWNTSDFITTRKTEFNPLSARELNNTSRMNTLNENWMLNEITIRNNSLETLDEDPIWFFPLLYSISAAGIILNLVFLFTVARIPDLKTTSNYYLINLAIADITVLYIFYVQKAVLELFSTQSLIVSGLMNVIRNTFSFISAYTISAVTIERFIAIYWPLKHLRLISKRRTIKLIIALWFISLASAIIGAPLYVSEYGYLIDIFLLVFFLFPFFISLTVTLVFYPLIVMKIVSKFRKKRSKTTTVQKERIQVIRLLSLTAIVYLVCIFPSLVYFMIIRIGITDSNTLFLTGRVLIFTNSSVNIIIYSMASSHFRKSLVMAFRCKSTSQIRKSSKSSQMRLTIRGFTYSSQLSPSLIDSRPNRGSTYSSQPSPSLNNSGPNRSSIYSIQPSPSLNDSRPIIS